MNFLKCLTTPLKGIPLEKVATDKKYIPLKKTEKFINGNYSLWENPRFLDLAAILTLNDLYYIMSHSESCD